MGTKSLVCCLALLVAFTATSAEPRAKAEGATGRQVMTWVPPYGIAKVQARLNESFGKLRMKDGLTHLGLQFWEPSKSGGLGRVSRYGEISDATISGFCDWGHTNGVRVLLCVFNGANSWDWPLARKAFATNRERFVKELVAEVKRLKLDGVDIDLEANGEQEADKAAFVRFIAELSQALHAKGCHLTVDTFAYIWNAPNQNWWPELLPLVDGLTSMGYEEIGVKGDKWRSYTAQTAAAGAQARKLFLGMPASKGDWQGSKLAEHLAWVREEGRVGVSFWDAKMDASAWCSEATWRELQTIRGMKRTAK